MNNCFPICYISPSTIPSRSANSIHVVQMCEELSALGFRVTIFFNRPMQRSNNLLSQIRENYNVKFENVSLISNFNRYGYGINYQIAHMAMLFIRKINGPVHIISRNLYASFYLSTIMYKRHVYETHELEYGIKRIMQKQIICRPDSVNIVISERLKELLAEHLFLKYIPNVLVCHDSAPIRRNNFIMTSKNSKYFHMVKNKNVNSYKAKCGYFGQLYAGRGVEVIQGMAEKRPDVAFFLFGGNEEDIIILKNRIKSNNLFIVGHVKYGESLYYMKQMDVLLMPYQEKVAIGNKNHDTARWMSPIKMFEYMSSHIPFISSRLPVLEEILVHMKNCLLASPNDIDDWCNCLDVIINHTELANGLATSAYNQFERNYSWKHRAKKIISSLNKLQKL